MRRTSFLGLTSSRTTLSACALLFGAFVVTACGSSVPEPNGSGGSGAGGDGTGGATTGTGGDNTGGDNTGGDNTGGSGGSGGTGVGGNQNTCAPTETLCGDTCVDTQTDEAHCGSCGNACLAGTSCVSGACASACPGPLALAAPPAAAVGDHPSAAASGDLNGDGKPDLVVVNEGDSSGVGSSVSVLVNDGVGGLAPQVVYAAGTRPKAVAIGDLNGDGKLDLAVANEGLPYGLNDPGGVSVLVNNGDGTFAAPVQLLAGSFPSGVAIGDLNGDGKPDLAVSDRGNFKGGAAVSVLLNAGGGAFAPAVSYAAGNGPTAIVIANLDGDDKPDLAVTNYGSSGAQGAPSGVSVLANAGDGTFGAPSFTTFAKQGAAYYAVAAVAGDFDGDGKIDLAIAKTDAGFSGYGGQVALLLNDGNAKFTEKGFYCHLGQNPHAITTGDVDGDGKLDVVTVDTRNDAQIWLNTGAALEPSRTYVVGRAPSAVTALDLDGDGKLDLAVAGAASDDVSLLRNQGGAAFPAPSLHSVGAWTPAEVVAADFDGDGKLDLATPNDGAGEVNLLLADGSGGFARQDLSDPDSPDMLATADFDGNGTIDLAFSNAGFGAKSVGVTLNQGNAAFAPSVYHQLAGPPSSVAAGDLNGDGKPDLVVASFGVDICGVGTVTVLLNAGGGSFQMQPALPAGVGSIGVKLADLNGDGALDLVVANAGEYQCEGSDVGVLLNDGKGAFAPQALYPTGPTPRSIAVVDLNGDGRRDLAVLHRKLFPDATSGVSLLLNTGNGAFAAPVEIPAGESPETIAGGDLNGDGKVDLVVGTQLDDSAAALVMLNDGNGAFTQQTALPVHGGMWITLADVDANGQLDLVTSTYESPFIGVHLAKGCAP